MWHHVTFDKELFKYFDKAIVRRFDSIIDFDRYNMDDLVNVAESFLNDYLTKFKFAGRNMKLFKKAPKSEKKHFELL